MRDRRPRLWVGIGLVVLCSGLAPAGWQPVEAQTVDVLSLPGDAPGSKAPFQREALMFLTPGKTFDEFFIDVPYGGGAAEVRIETVTARCELPIGQVVRVGIRTYVAQPNPSSGEHEIALAPAGTYVDSEGTSTAVYTGTHYLRLLDDSKSGFFLFVSRKGEKVGGLTCNVSVSGYTTPGSPKVRPVP